MDGPEMRTPPPPAKVDYIDSLCMSQYVLAKGRRFSNVWVRGHSLDTLRGTYSRAQFSQFLGVGRGVEVPSLS